MTHTALLYFDGQCRRWPCASVPATLRSSPVAVRMIAGYVLAPHSRERLAELRGAALNATDLQPFLRIDISEVTDLGPISVQTETHLCKSADR